MADPRKLDERDLGHLKLAGDWKLLRDMSGWKVCMTGKMSMERSQLAALVEAAGGQFTNSMSSSVRLLIVADDATWTTKLEKAEEAGTLVMRESAFAAELLPTPAELLSGVRASFGTERP